MLDIKREAPRFLIDFDILSNNIRGAGVNISLKGIGFLTPDEIVPADNIPFRVHIKEKFLNNREFIFEGSGNILYSERSRKYEGFYCGFEFVELTGRSRENLLTLLYDMIHYERDCRSGIDCNTREYFSSYPSKDIVNKAELFYNFKNDILAGRYEMQFYNRVEDYGNTALFLKTDQVQPIRMINFASNDFFGLSHTSAVVESGIAMVRRYGAGNRMLPVHGAMFAIYREVEEKICELTGQEDALLFNSGYSAALGAITGLVRPNDVVIMNQSCRQGLADGAYLSKARRLFFSDFDPVNFAKMLKRVRERYYGKLIAFNSLNPFTGRRAPLKELMAELNDFNYTVLVDESYTTGLYGSQGAGWHGENETAGKIDIIVSSLSETFGVNGGFAAGKKEIIEYIRCYSNPYLYSSPISPFDAGALMKAIEIVRESDELRQRLMNVIEKFTAAVRGIGLPVVDSGSPIIGITIPDIEIAKKVSRALFDEKIYHMLVTPPFVPLGGSLLRFSMNIHHTDADIERAVAVMREAMRAEGIL